MTAGNDIELQYRVSQFLFREARLLDDQEWDEWNALFSDEGVYWAPASPDQPDPLNHVSLIYEDDLLRKVRIARFKSPAAYSLQPFPRTSHLVSNVMIDETEGDTISAASRFVMTEYRRDKAVTFSGGYIHSLERAGSSFKIRQKKATLVNCDGIHESSSVYF